MTKVRIDEGAHRVSISGHSGYASAGQDIVCAGISSLAWALAATLSKERMLLIVTEKDGDMEIKYTGGAEPYLDMFRVGISLISAKYPENLILVQGRNLPDESVIIEEKEVV